MFQMGRHILIPFFLCFLALRESHASCAPEDYWKHKLPTTSMPQSIKDSLIPTVTVTVGPPHTGEDVGPPHRGEADTNSLAGTNGYIGLLSYAKTSTKDESLAAGTNGYIGLLSYAKSSKKDLHPITNGYDGLLSYAKPSRKDSHSSSAYGYDGLLSYAKSNSKKDTQTSTNGYDGLLSYAKLSTKDSLASTNGYDGLLSYAKSNSKKDSQTSTNGYDGLLSYAKVSTKDSIASSNGYDGLLSYAKAPAKNSLASSNGYDGGLSYAKTSRKLLASTNGYDGLLSYAKTSTKEPLADTNGYKGLLSYAKASTKNSPAGTKDYDGLLSYAKDSTKNLEDSTNGYKGLLSYAKESSKCNDKESPSTAANIMEDHGKKMNLIFKKGNNKAIFLPREVANKIPFSSDKLPEIYNILSLDPKSQDAYIVSRRIELCEEPKVEGVQKKCVTSLESMVDFVVSKIGSNVKALTTDVEKDYPKMEYTIKEVRKISKNDHETVVCHKMGYPYALFFCHGTDTIRSYMVSLVGNDGTKIEAVAACHKETNDFLSNYMVNVLKVVPGSTRVCHFPGAQDNIIWVAN